MHNELKLKLQTWVDWDVAAYYLAQSLGLMDESVKFHDRAKHIFWTDNIIGNTLNVMLEQLVICRILEKRDEPDLQYQWNQSFKGSWE